MPSISLTNIVLVLFILYRVIKRQLAVRVLRYKIDFYALLMIIGIASIVEAVQKHQVKITLMQAMIFSIGSLLSAVVFGLLRAYTYRIWVNDQHLVVRKGNVYTLVFWVVGIGTHLLVDLVWKGSAVTLLLYLGVTLFVQRGALWLRARHQYPSELKHNMQASAERHHQK